MVSHFSKAKMESMNYFLVVLFYLFFLNLNNNYFVIGNLMGILAMLAPLALGMVGPPLQELYTFFFFFTFLPLSEMS